MSTATRTGHLVGYARVSTGHQTLDGQHDALNAARVDRIFDDVMSSTRSDRPGLAAALDYVREGDTLVVPALDRLGRSLVDTINTLDALRKRGIYVRALREGIDTSTLAGRMVAGVFASLAELERELIHERAAVAREAAKARGQQTGRPKALTDEQVGVARRMRESGESVATITKTLGISRATFYRVLAD
ncbi:recombinase family protein [Rhodococcus erythropolis]|uniref:recombinase family protein n=1 Tax=Rhodococcus erythropolis TaxID=1833 RepID=UPI001292ABFA|nr:recombinase family protein [Rhodococcus erythropolis]MCW2298414.1 DNA invertase Pin-like site-specific DNA recombinase [Rhodococcus erythropolis]MQP36048.1 helix-turn-helix domain-containing protein [Rhodococcus erythropolis]